MLPHIGRISTPINVSQLAQAEPILVRWRRIAVDDQRWPRRQKRLAHPLVQLIVGDGAPERRLIVFHRDDVKLRHSRVNAKPFTATYCIRLFWKQGWLTDNVVRLFLFHHDKIISDALQKYI